ncbi:Bug family tripartite tricarboxylate transporter substrate binding protein [Sabulicella rubraurantiaca]|uniref:Bug family tripartite tricarboxylate transporter substrate binding protein n=1 Tax=Sabulicella rubraurantiaca TaxID=2811429 RepID=UPI001A966B68|nr:tripartite tricarboxylate transporter substrate binding protein [Sabulicella rubraurantiaca]
MPRTTRRATLALAPLALATPALAQSRTVTIIVPFAPGGSTDTVSRLMAERMSAVLGQNVVVENRPGGNTIVGAEAVARAAPDGSTTLMAAGTTLTINPAIHRNLSYKVEDFAPVMLVSTFPFAVIARHNGPADIAALAAAARERPGRITYGTNGPTTLTNVAMLMVLERMGVTMQDVTYRGDAQSQTAFMAGDIDLLVVAGSTALPVFRNNQGRILGWTSAERVPSTPDVPTFAESYPGLVAESWFGLLAPARTPPATVERLNVAANEALREPRVRERLTNEAQFLKGGTPAEFGAFLASEAQRWRPVLSRLEVPQN